MEGKVLSSIIDQIFAVFRERGGRDYGERISVLEHSLQAARAAEQDDASPTLVAAALLHDYGHLIHDLPEDIADQGIDAMHEQLGADFLAAYFVPEVVEPVRLHVAAKRYLCAVDTAYLAGLSPASARSLALQGGPFDAAEITAFESSPHVADAVRLRRYDDLGKQPGMRTPDLEHYRAALEVALK
jgi:phosphonate degradation associated HDIG domain protein